MRNSFARAREPPHVSRTDVATSPLELLSGPANTHMGSTSESARPIGIERGLLSRKTVNSLGAIVNEAAADLSMDFGRRMLAKFGWSEGKGLGKQENGTTTHIRVKQRADQLGLGAVEKAPTAWAPPPDSIAAVAAKHEKKRKREKKAKKKAKAAGSDDDSDSESEGEREVKRRLQGSGVLPGLSDEALFELCGGARLHRGSRSGTGKGKIERTAEADRAFLAKYGGGDSTAAGDEAAKAVKEAADEAARKAAALKAERAAEAEAAAKAEAEAKAAKRARKEAKRARKAEEEAKNAAAAGVAAGAATTDAELERKRKAKEDRRAAKKAAKTAQ